MNKNVSPFRRALGEPYTGTDRVAYAQLALCATIWGGTFVAGRGISSDLPVLVLASARFILASIVLLCMLALSANGFSRLSLKQAAKITLLGFFGIFVYNVCFFYGLREVDASRASLIIAINPAAMALAGWLCFKEKLSLTRIMAVALCLLGAGIVILNRSTPGLSGTAGTVTGDVWILGCVISWVIYSVFGRDTVRELGALQTVTYSVVVGTMMLVIAALATGQAKGFSFGAISPTTFGGLLYLGILGSALAYVLYYDGIQKIGSTRAGAFIALNPLTAVIGGAIFLGERLATPVLVGGFVVICGIFLSNSRAALGTQVN
jgi:drug/metabolite transporter (DMT)-like permease